MGTHKAPPGNLSNLAVEMQQKPGKDGWEHPVGGREKAVRNLMQLKAALGLHKYGLGNKKALRRFRFEQCKGTYRMIQL